jgi:SAM-dependent methyltransferase
MPSITTAFSEAIAMSDSVPLFSTQSDAYAEFRPTYPPGLFDWLANQCRDHSRALDIAAGSGQASLPLQQHFADVLACDASAAQLHGSDDWQSVRRFVAHAERQPLADRQLDLIVVAQALHWFATPAFFAEVRRLLKPQGLFCAWCYSLLSIDPPLDRLITQLHGDTLRGCWPQGRASVDAGYRDIQLPFRRITVPNLAIETQWTLAQLLGYLRTWSAVKQWQQRHGQDPVALLAPQLSQHWGDPQHSRTIRWPLHLIAGRPGAEGESDA